MKKNDDIARILAPTKEELERTRANAQQMVRSEARRTIDMAKFGLEFAEVGADALFEHCDDDAERAAVSLFLRRMLKRFDERFEGSR